MTEKKFTLKRMKVKLFIKFVLWITVIPFIAAAQNDAKKSVALTAIQYATADRAGDFYAVAKAGIYKFDQELNQIASLAIGEPTLFDTGNGVRMLCFTKKDKAIKILSPTLQEISSLELDESIAIDPILACSSGDYGVLVLDKADWSLKVVDTRESTVTAEYKIEVQGQRDYTFMRMYQNFVFLLNSKTGIEIYNKMGKHLKTIPAEGLTAFNFLGEELYYYLADTLHFVDLYTLESREQKIDGNNCKSVLLTETRLVKIFPSKLEMTTLSH